MAMTYTWHQNGLLCLLTPILRVVKSWGKQLGTEAKGNTFPHPWLCFRHMKINQLKAQRSSHPQGGKHQRRTQGATRSLHRLPRSRFITRVTGAGVYRWTERLWIPGEWRQPGKCDCHWDISEKARTALEFCFRTRDNQAARKCHG